MQYLSKPDLSIEYYQMQTLLAILAIADICHVLGSSPSVTEKSRGSICSLFPK